MPLNQLEPGRYATMSVDYNLLCQQTINNTVSLGKQIMSEARRRLDALGIPYFADGNETTHVKTDWFADPERTTQALDDTVGGKLPFIFSITDVDLESVIPKTENPQGEHRPAIAA